MPPDDPDDELEPPRLPDSCPLLEPLPLMPEPPDEPDALPPCEPPRVAELPMPSSPWFPRSVRPLWFPAPEPLSPLSPELPPLALREPLELPAPRSLFWFPVPWDPRFLSSFL